MRVHRGMSELGRDQASFQILREHVLENLRLGVNAVPGHAQGVGQEALEQAVMADHLQGQLAPICGKANPSIGRVRDQPQLAELLQHRRHRSGRDAEPFREGVGRDRLVAVGLKRKDRLGVILDGR